jgi:serine/threonine protein kinase
MNDNVLLLFELEMTTNIFFQNENDEFSNIQSLPTQNYKFVSIIGKGAFSTVILVQSKIDQKYSAMKIMKKKRILETGFSENILTEKAILSSIEHPFMVKLKESFQDSEKLYLVMDYCPGGELLGLLETADKLS